MKKIIKYILYLIGITSVLLIGNVYYAKGNQITLNKALTDDINHTFQYSKLKIDKNVKPYSITLSVENGYFKTNNEELNNKVSEYFNFMGGTNTSNDYVQYLETDVNYKLITFNLKSTVDITDSTVRESVISSIEEFLRNIVFYNEENKDAKFTLSFSEVALKFSDEENSLNNLDVVAFKDPNQPKEHYYIRIDSPKIKWTDAYNIAASLKWNNLQGYLVTITSEEEHNFIYQSLGSIKGWMGSAAITNFDDVTYNTKNISWNPAIGELKPSYGHLVEGDAQNDNDIETYWHWVAGPEAGTKVFRENAYTNFTNGEPNNFSGLEWCGEYGHGNNGMWNDYPNSIDDIQGFYVEFGGFEEELETVEPVKLVSTFKWKDYDFRNIEDKIDENFDNIEFKKETTNEEISNEIEKALLESGIEDTTYEIKNRKISKNKLTFDVEISIGKDGQVSTYVIHVKKSIIANPQTGDSILIYVSILLISVIGIIFNNKYIIKKEYSR